MGGQLNLRVFIAGSCEDNTDEKQFSIPASSRVIVIPWERIRETLFS